jgi:AraC family transcriptional regulator
MWKRVDTTTETAEVPMLTPQIVDKPELVVVGLEAPFISVLSPDANNFSVIGRLWEQFGHQAGKVPNRIGHDMFGLCFDRPAVERRHPHEMQYLAGVRAGSLADIPKGMTAHTVPAGTFAVFTHRGPIRNFGDTVAEIYRVWLPQSGYRHAGVADVELYDDRFCVDGDDSEMEYWIPVVPRS